MRHIDAYFLFELFGGFFFVSFAFTIAWEFGTRKRNCKRAAKRSALTACAGLILYLAYISAT